MKKPEKYTLPPVYSYRDIIDFIEEKYNIKTRGYKEEKDKIYRDFWHWVLHLNEGKISNQGCLIRFDLECDIDIDEFLGQTITEDQYIGVSKYPSSPNCREDGSGKDKPYPPWAIEILQLIVKEFPDIVNTEHLCVWLEW